MAGISMYADGKSQQMAGFEEHTVSHYRVLRHIGAGGMGVVYEAEDLSLGRHVALKFLPPDLRRNALAAERFQQEARAASALNHPNICTIYEVGTADGELFIAMELLAGETLDHAVQHREFPATEIIEIGIALADGLDAAHSSGIVHRDIKPANIFLTSRGVPKILDFGLAKASADRLVNARSDVSSGSTVAAHLTSPGVAVGTIAFMSPEQARGEQLDGRSDLFSLGAVLYHLAARQLPFDGETSAVIFDAILNRDPVPVADRNPSLPPRLAEIIHTALEKDRELRYQSAAELRAELKRLKRSSGAAVGAVRDSATAGSSQRVAAAVAGTTPAALSSSASTRRRVAPWMAAAAVAAVALAGGGWWYARQPADSVPINLENVQITRLTDSGEASAVAISPDGRYVSYVQGTPERQALWVRQIATSSDLQIQPPDAVRYTGVAFSRDGNYIYFTRSDRSTFLYNYLYVIPSLGGTPRQLVKDVDTAVGFSPDGTRIAFIRGAPDEGKQLLVVANADGSGEKVLWSAVSETSTSAMTAPDWSPDGAHIAVAWADRQVLGTGTITIVDAGTGEGAALLHHQGRVGRARWLADGSGLLIPLDDRLGERAQIYHVTYPGGALRRVTNDLADYSRQHFDMTADGRTLAIVQETRAFNLEVADGGGRESTQIVSGGNMTTFAWGPDGRIYYAAGGQIYRIDHDGSNRAPVTGSGVFADAAKPCGPQAIVFINHESDASFLSRADADGSNVRRIGPTGGGLFDCAFDGSFVVFSQDAASGRVLMRAGLDGSAPRQLVDRIAGRPAVSPDGTMVAVQYWRTLTADGNEMGVFSTTGEKLQVVPLPGTSRGQAIWSPDGKALQYLVYRGGANIWEQPIAGGPPRQVTSFSSKPISFWAWSQDGKQLAILQGGIRTDVVVMSGFN